MPHLTGSRPTGELPVVTVDAVTVTVARTPVLGREEEFEVTLRTLMAAAERAPGSLGGGILAPGPLHREWHVVLRFSDVISLRRWETSVERETILETLDALTEQTRVVTAPSPDTWFEANDVPAETPQKKRLRDLMWAFPVAFAVAGLVAPAMYHLPLLVRAGTSSLVGVGVGFLLVAPLRKKWRAYQIAKDPLL